MALIDITTSIPPSSEDAFAEDGQTLQKQAEASSEIENERNLGAGASTTRRSALTKLAPRKKPVPGRRRPGSQTGVVGERGVAVAAATGDIRAQRPQNALVPPQSKTDTVLRKLRLARGATIAQLAEATGWQLHSVRGFLSGTVRKKLGLRLVSETGKDGIRRYRIEDEHGGTSGKAG